MLPDRSSAEQKQDTDKYEYRSESIHDAFSDEEDRMAEVQQTNKAISNQRIFTGPYYTDRPKSRFM